MNFRIADTFTESLARLMGEEQKVVKTTAFDLQLNPARPGMSFHRLDRAKDKNFWSVRAGSDLRLIVHKTADSLLLCYVDHHDRAYDWAERRRVETHPKTGAAQLVEIRETVVEVTVPQYIETAVPVSTEPPAPPVGKPVRKATTTKKVPKSLPPLFAHLSDDVLLGYGVPADWLADVKQATEETLLAFADHLPAEAAEALLELATGGKPRPSQPAKPTQDPFDHPDARRRFRVLTNVEELERALEFPWDKWTVFLHPEQRQLVEREYNGPARVSGSAGTGKTIVALHRAAWLVRNRPENRVVLTTFSDPLAAALRSRLRRLIGNEPRLFDRIEVLSLPAWGERLHTTRLGPVRVAPRQFVREQLREIAAATRGHKFSPSFLLAEWNEVVDAWNVDSVDAYRAAPRLGRKSRLSEQQRALLWSIYGGLRERLATAGFVTESDLFAALARSVAAKGIPPCDHVVVDESQDTTVAQMKFLAAVGAARPDALFFAGDLGQRIFQQPFSWKSLGVDIRGRSRTLRINYRTSHQIRGQADRLLGPQVSDLDGNVEERGDTISVFNGPAPVVMRLADEQAEIDTVGTWLAERVREGLPPHECGLFVRSDAQLDRARAALKVAGVAGHELDDRVESQPGKVSFSTMHRAKGLEFRAVVVMACDDDVIPLQERIESIGDDADLADVYDTERHLLYVACTRARDHLLLTAVKPGSEFLDDFEGERRGT